MKINFIEVKKCFSQKEEFEANVEAAAPLVVQIFQPTSACFDRP